MNKKRTNKSKTPKKSTAARSGAPRTPGAPGTSGTSGRKRRGFAPKAKKSAAPGAGNAGRRSEEKITGILRKAKKGFGFVLAEDGGKDVFIPASKMEGAMNGDRVQAHIASGRGRKGAEPLDPSAAPPRREGRVVKIVERAVTEVVGVFEQNRNVGLVIPDARRGQAELFVAAKNFGGAKPGDWVAAAITKYPDAVSSAEGKIIQIIAGAGEPGGDILAMIRSYGLSKEFPPGVEAAAAAVPQKLSERDTAGRRDLRGETIVTIDGADSKDFDDAVSIKKQANGTYKLSVHIADVSHYVTEDSILDREALNRGTSVYLLDQVAPMLPVSLSNGICSLNEKVDRLTLSVEMTVGKTGNVLRHKIYESVICSRARLVYTDISDLLENGDEELKKKHKDIYEDLLLMAELADLLREKREKRGSIDFDLDEANIQLGPDGIPVLVSVAERRTANRLIEEFMLLANETVAEAYCSEGMPFVYRVHERPGADKIREFKTFLGGFGLSLKGEPDSVAPQAFNTLLAGIKDRPEENVVNTVMLRSMKKAFYGTSCEGHFGLSVQYYCHFTSPIRRYPDLLVHRIIKEHLHGGLEGERREALQGKAEYAAERSSETERKALELEREVEKMKKTEYMSYHIGEEWDAVISGVTAFGFFAELPNTVEGLVHVDTLTDDYYIYEPEKYRLIGERTKRTWTLGDALRVRVASVDVDNREINFTGV
ncbi:MAG: ribonuclease R [Clostridiales Family XIII bacterium]|jgi:ribonuclease R|nr:ribonuclease R [Clostridiales Family XIII bacterium]